MSKTRDNHYVPQWYQRGFLPTPSNQLHYLDLTPDKRELADGRVVTMHNYHHWPTSKCFFQRDLYSTFFGPFINDEIEKKLFGSIDDTGSKAVWSFIKGDHSECHNRFFDFFSYIDTQKIRTPKGLDWIKKHYPDLDQLQLMIEMQSLRNMHCTIWTEGVREIVSAENSNLKFILSDHPVTIYNYACPPEERDCRYPNDPSIAFKASQTIFPLDMNHCLILTNYEYAKNPDLKDPTSNRTNARNFRNSMVRTDAFIRSRSLNEDEVRQINFIIKKRARRYIAATTKEGLYPEQRGELDWSQLRKTLLPPENGMFHFGGEMYIGYEDGSVHYQDAFGRTTPENPHLKKKKRKAEPGPNESCTCGSGKKYKKCCKNKDPSQRPSSNELSIRERNLAFLRGVENILGISKGKTWEDVRRELSDEQVKNIHELFGFLWPIETDIISLLPKPDGSLRALYTGLIDPRTISKVATSFTLYFDEILIQNPFTNPASVKPKYSPVENPHQYKQQTLKNVLLLAILAPFIEAGFINFIPDLCVFDRHLQQQMFSMAEARIKSHTMDETEKNQMEELHKSDFERSMLMLSKEQQRIQIRKVHPNHSEAEVEELLELIDEKNKQDPLTLLQDDVYSKEKGGQFTMMSMTPNFEIALFIAQVTGSFIFTDSLFRWRELTGAQHKEKGVVSYHWHELTKCLDRVEFPVNAHADIVFRSRAAGRLRDIRTVFGEVYSAIQKEPDSTRIKKLKKSFANVYQTLPEEMVDVKGLNVEDDVEVEQYIFRGKLNCLIPKGGIVHNNVQRMLLSSGLSNALKNVPMAILVEF